MICKQCGHELYVVKNLTEYDRRDGIREARYCNTCHILFSSHAHGLNKIVSLSTNAERQLQSENAALRELSDERGKEICRLWKTINETDGKLAGLVEAAIKFQREAVVLSEEYLEAFKDWKEDACIQGWKKARWERALTARKNLTKAIAAAEK